MRQVIMRFEGAKQPCTVPFAIILYKKDHQYVVHNHVFIVDGDNGAWSLQNGFYERDTIEGYGRAYDEYMDRVKRYAEWYKHHTNLDHIEVYVGEYAKA